MSYIDLKGPIVANTVYVDGQLVARDVTITLPSVTPTTADYRAMGTMSLPTPGQFESMELAITKIGIDLGLGRMVRMQSMNFEFRFVQNVVKSDGTTKPEGCKAFVKAIPKTIPGISLEPGSASENEITAEVTRYQLFVGGEELWLIDRLSQICRILGTDYYSPINSLL